MPIHTTIAHRSETAAATADLIERYQHVVYPFFREITQ